MILLLSLVQLMMLVMCLTAHSLAVVVGLQDGHPWPMLINLFSAYMWVALLVRDLPGIIDNIFEEFQ